MANKEIEAALARLRAMAERPLPPKPVYNLEVAEQIELAAQYQADLQIVLAEFDLLRAKLTVH